MEASRLLGFVRPARHLTVALVLLVCALVVVPTAGAAAASSAKRPTATAATLKLKLSATERERTRLKAFIRRNCKPGGRRCAASRARLAKTQARAASLRNALRRRPKAKPTKPAGSTPAAGSGSTAPGGATTGTGATKPTTGTPTPTTPTPSAPTPPAPKPTGTTFQPGVNSGTTFEYDIPGAQRLGAKLVRLEFPIGSSVAWLRNAIQRYADVGIRVQPLAGFPGRTPTVAEAQNLATWAAAYGPGGTFWANRSDGNLAIRSIEFGNETSMGYQYGDGSADASYQLRARNYALRFKDAVTAIRAAGSNVGMLAQVDDWTGIWLDNMYAAVPSFHSYVSGWTSHPYGNSWKSTLSNLVTHTADHGAPATIPVDITEWGLTVDNGHCLVHNYGWNRCMGTTEAAAVMHQTIAEMRSFLGGRLRTFLFYQVRDQAETGQTDDAEAYFGLQTHFNGDKGAMTAQARAELAVTS
jgi:hypothetical protein